MNAYLIRGEVTKYAAVAGGRPERIKVEIRELVFAESDMRASEIYHSRHESGLKPATITSFEQVASDVDREEGFGSPEDELWGGESAEGRSSGERKIETRVVGQRG